MRLKKPLFGVCDAGNYWDTTMNEHLTNYIAMSPIVEDSQLNVKKCGKQVIRISGSYVEDSSKAGANEFQGLTEKT